MEQKEKSIEEKSKAIGKKMQKAGCALTCGVTLPIMGLALFGIPGLVIGGIVGIACIMGMFQK